MKNTVKKILSVLSAAAFCCVALAGCAPAGTTDAAAGGTTSTLIMTVAMIAVFYFILIRPEKKRKKQLEDMRSSLSVGNEVVTIGGICGKIVHVNDEKVVIETGEDRVRIELTKWAISTKS